MNIRETLHMKLRITRDDIAHLTSTQKINLRRLWVPKLYEIALASVCVNVETDQYAEFEFSIGSVLMRPNGAMQLKDLRAVDGYTPFDEEEREYEDPVSFSKEDCLPLLSIGEMIDMMQNVNFRNFHFYLLAGTGVTGCEVGHFRSALKDKILTEGYQSEELCDVLWHMIQAQI